MALRVRSAGMATNPSYAAFACVRTVKPQVAIQRAYSTRDPVQDRIDTCETSVRGAVAPKGRDLQITPQASNPGMACFRRADGSLVCEAIPTGVYDVVPAPPTWEGKAFCSTVNGRVECVTYCHVTPEGHLVCTGLEEGRYRVVAAQDADVDHLVHHIWACTYSEDEDDQLGLH